MGVHVFITYLSRSWLCYSYSVDIGICSEFLNDLVRYKRISPAVLVILLKMPM
jgi:hypothetical protein